MSFTPQSKKTKTQSMSMTGETFRALKECWRNILPLMLVYCLVSLGLGAANYKANPIASPAVVECFSSENKEECLREKGFSEEEENRNPSAFLFFSLLGMCVNLVFVYLVSVTYMKETMKQPPRASLAGFWKYFVKIVWKYIRPVMWNLIPLFGQVMYVRSLVRREIVGPLVLLGRDNELSASWDMTEGKAMRIFGASLTLATVCYLPMMLISSVAAFFAIDMENPAKMLERMNSFVSFSILMSSIAYSVMLAAWAIFPFAVYRVLLEEKNIN